MLASRFRSARKWFEKCSIGTTSTAEALAKAVSNKVTNPHRILILCGFFVFGWHNLTKSYPLIQPLEGGHEGDKEKFLFCPPRDSETLADTGFHRIEVVMWRT
ncbi:hypothetical protein A3860_14735 [Niastella vici]|uniref:Uncharacterized protein n=1 Tax=Niastella vici TaxID=1703345 RepID=A0A1V9G5J0_9BACT|nr:hypothetical protein A3860_14735 [Niastella vici]